MKTFKELLEGVIQPNGTDKIKVEALKDTCWKGYQAIGTKKKNGREVPNCVPVKEEALDEGKMAQLHADIEDHMSKHVANYKKMGGADHLGNKSVEVAKKIAKLHNISHEAAQKHVNDYVDNHLKEETEAEKAAKELKLKLTKWKNQQRAAKALKEAHEVHVSDGSKYDEEPHKDDVKHVNDGLKKHGGEFSGHSDKGAYFKFKSHSDAENFRRHVNSCPKRTCSADHLEESVEQIDEISKETMGSYIHKSFAAGNELHKQIDKETDPNKKAELKAKLSKRNTGIMKAGKKLIEDVSMLSFDDYLKEQKACKKEELHPNQKKLDKNNNGKLDSDDFVKLRAGKKEVDEKYVSDAQRKAVWASKNEKGVKEEVELDEVMTPMQKLRDALDRHSEKAVAANKAGDHEAVKVHLGYVNRIKTKMGKLAKNEEVDLQEMEELCEISKSTLKSYVKKAVTDVGFRGIDAGKNSNSMDRLKAYDKMGKRVKGVEKATNKLAKEEVEQIDEISKKTLGSYVKKASTDAAKREVRIDRAMDASGSNYNEPSMQKALNKNAKRFAGISKAADKLAKEETEQIDEISKDTLKSYVKGAAQDLPRLGNTLGRLQTHGKLKNVEKNISKTINNRYNGINKATEKLAKEEVEQISEADVAAIRAQYKKNESDNKHTENAVLLAKHFGSKSDQNKANKAKAHRDAHGGYGSDPLGRHYAKLSHEVHSKLYHHIKEDVEQIDEAYRLPNDSEISKVKAHVKANHPNKSLAQVAVHKQTKKIEYVVKDKEGKMTGHTLGEEVEQIDELDKNTLGNYVKKAHNQLVAHSARKAAKYERGDKDALDYDIKHARKEVNREGGIKRAVNKLTKEDTEVITFKQLMENISEAKIDDLKDRIAARKATQSAYDKDYKPSAKSNVQKVKGHSYGAGEEEGEDDDDTKKVSKPAAPEVKRGRGRPAGSKSGARR